MHIKIKSLLFKNTDVWNSQQTSYSRLSEAGIQSAVFVKSSPGDSNTLPMLKTTGLLGEQMEEEVDFKLTVEYWVKGAPGVASLTLSLADGKLYLSQSPWCGQWMKRAGVAEACSLCLQFSLHSHPTPRLCDFTGLHSLAGKSAKIKKLETTT